MRNILLIILLACLPSITKAQFFNFGFDDFFGTPMRVEMAEAEYDGTTSQMEAFLKANFKNPSGQQGINGKVIVECFVNEKGEVVETNIIQGLRDPFNREARRVASLLKFKPLASDNDHSGRAKENTQKNKAKSRDNQNNDTRSSNNNRRGNNGMSSGSSIDQRQGNYYNRSRNRQNDNLRKSNVTFPIKNGKLNFLNVATIEV